MPRPLLTLFFLLHCPQGFSCSLPLPKALLPSTGIPLILQVTSGLGLPCTWQSRRAVSPGPYRWLWGLCSQYGAAARKGTTALSL